MVRTLKLVYKSIVKNPHPSELLVSDSFVPYRGSRKFLTFIMFRKSNTVRDLKNFVGHANNEVIEIIIGVICNIVGGIFIGAAANQFSWLFLSSAIAFSIAGIIFDVRVVAKHSHELRQVRDEIRFARIENQNTIAKMREQQVVINEATKQLRDMIKSIKEHEKELKEIERKAFSFIGSRSRQKSLEDMIKRLDERLAAVEAKNKMPFSGRPRL
jgi:hypothetical protein